MFLSLVNMVLKINSVNQELNRFNLNDRPRGCSFVKMLHENVWNRRDNL